MTQRPTPPLGSVFAFSPLSMTYRERATGLEPATSSLGRRTKRTTDSVKRQFPTANVLLTALGANALAVEKGACGPLRPPLS
jgi:hypothetical protein